MGNPLIGGREFARLASHAVGTSKKIDPTPLSFFLRINRYERARGLSSAGQTQKFPDFVVECLDKRGLEGMKWPM
jgi:hypothetical protein